MKILVLNGHKYSRELFEDYKIRAKFELDVKGQAYTNSIDIYTTDEDKNNVFKIISSKTSDRVLGIRIINWTTKEQDDRNTLFIEETLKDI